MRLYILTAIVMLGIVAQSAIPEAKIHIHFPKKKQLRKRPIAIEFTTMYGDSVEVILRDFDKKIKKRDQLYIPADSTVSYYLKTKDYKMGIYFLDIKKDNTVIGSYTLFHSFLRNKIVEGQ